jgi:hypothetical protein
MAGRMLLLSRFNYPVQYGRFAVRQASAIRWCLAIALTAVLAIAGCSWDRPFGSRAGTVEQQRFNASMHDPYSDNDAGPEVVGGRPRDFQQPRDEPIRSRAHPASNTNSWWSNWFGR